MPTVRLSRPNMPLRGALVEKFGTLSEAAFIMQINDSLLSKILQGRRQPGPRHLEMFRQYLGDETVRRCFPDLK